MSISNITITPNKMNSCSLIYSSTYLVCDHSPPRPQNGFLQKVSLKAGGKQSPCIVFGLHIPSLYNSSVFLFSFFQCHLLENLGLELANCFHLVALNLLFLPLSLSYLFLKGMYFRETKRLEEGTFFREESQ